MSPQDGLDPRRRKIHILRMFDIFLHKLFHPQYFEKVFLFRFGPWEYPMREIRSLKEEDNSVR